MRLLTLEPGLWDTCIKCRLSHANLTDKPIYDALSYMWGNATDIRQILLDGHVWEITANLEVALRYLRKEHETLILWVDALCINQADLPERALQVQRMRNIYSSARKVLAWVGEPNEDTENAMDTIRKIATAYLTTGTFQSCEDQLEEVWEQLKVALTFLMRPYWSRVWVIQELASCTLSVLDLSDAEQDRCMVGCGMKWLPKLMLDAFIVVLSITKQPLGQVLLSMREDDSALSNNNFLGGLDSIPGAMMFIVLN